MPRAHTALNQALNKNRIDGKFRNPNPRIVRARVVTAGQGGNLNQPYQGDMGQFRKGTIVEARNVASDANPYLVAEHAASSGTTGGAGKRAAGTNDTIGGLTTDELGTIIRGIAEDLINPPPRYNDPDGDTTDDEFDRDTDANNDGVPDDENTDTDGDGIPDVLEDYIRFVTGPILGGTTGGDITSSDADSFTFTVPDGTMAGDTIVIIAINRTQHDDSEVSGAGGVFQMGVDTYTGFTTQGDSAATTESTGTYPDRKVASQSFTRIAAGTTGNESTDVGDDFVFEFIFAPESYWVYTMVLKYDVLSGPWDIAYGFNDIDGFGDPVQSDFYVDSLSISNNDSLYIVIGAINEDIRTTPESGYSQLADDGNADVSIFVAAKIVASGATGVWNGTMDNASAFFASHGLEIEP